MMQPSRELDIEIGQKVIGGLVMLSDDPKDHTIMTPSTKQYGKLPYYSTSEDDLLFLYDFLSNRDVHIQIRSNTENDVSTFHCRMKKDQYQTPFVEGVSIPHSTCLAALHLAEAVCI